MLRWPGTIVGLVLLVMSSTASWAGPPVPTLTGRVMDLANVLSGVQKRDLTDKLAKIQARTGIQIVLVSLPHLGQYSIEAWGLALGRAWKIGRSGKDDGIVIVLAPNDREVRIEVGYGLEDEVPDAVAYRIIQTHMLPEARKGNYAAGLAATIDGLVRAITQPAALTWLSSLEGDKITIGLVILLGGCVVILTFGLAYLITFRARRAYPLVGDERATSVFDSAQYSDRTTQSDYRYDRTDSWSDSDRSSSDDRGFSGLGGSFGGGGATGKW